MNWYFQTMSAFIALFFPFFFHIKEKDEDMEEYNKREFRSFKGIGNV